MPLGDYFGNGGILAALMNNQTQAPPLMGGLFGLGQSQPLSQLMRSPAETAVQQYPVLRGIGLRAVNGSRNGNVIEFWPPGESGGADYARPQGLPLNYPGIEVGPNARPIDILGDVVSHHLINTDDRLRRTYSAFANSITPRQEMMLRNQYDYAKRNEGETRPYDQWRDKTGLPAFFRGYPFQQWPAEYQKAYTPQQVQVLDAMMSYLRGGR